MRTLHLGIRVADIQRSIAFYSALGYEVLGELPATELGGLTMLQLPEDEFVSLELVHDPAHGHVSPGGLSHVVISVDSVADTVDRLAARGVEVAPDPTSPDGSGQMWTAWLADPDGYRPELVQWPAGDPARHDPQRPRGADLMSERTAKDVVDEMFRRQQRVTTRVGRPRRGDIVNHAAGSQGREGLKTILSTIEDDLGPISVEQHHLIGEGDLVAQHLTLHGTHQPPRCRCSPTCPSPGGPRPGRSSTSGGSPTESSWSTGPAVTTWACSSNSATDHAGTATQWMSGLQRRMRRPVTGLERFRVRSASCDSSTAFRCSASRAGMGRPARLRWSGRRPRPRCRTPLEPTSVEESQLTRWSNSGIPTPSATAPTMRYTSSTRPTDRSPVHIVRLPKTTHSPSVASRSSATPVGGTTECLLRPRRARRRARAGGTRARTPAGPRRRPACASPGDRASTVEPGLSVWSGWSASVGVGVGVRVLRRCRHGRSVPKMLLGNRITHLDQNLGMWSSAREQASRGGPPRGQPFPSLCTRHRPQPAPVPHPRRGDSP